MCQDLSFVIEVYILQKISVAKIAVLSKRVGLVSRSSQYCFLKVTNVLDPVEIW